MDCVQKEISCTQGVKLLVVLEERWCMILLDRAHLTNPVSIRVQCQGAFWLYYYFFSYFACKYTTYGTGYVDGYPPHIQTAYKAHTKTETPKCTCYDRSNTLMTRVPNACLTAGLGTFFLFPQCALTYCCVLCRFANWVFSWCVGWLVATFINDIDD